MAKLTGAEIVAIIRAGHDAQVAKLEIGAIKITFKDAVDETISYNLNYQPNQDSTPQQEATPDLQKTMQSELDDYLLSVTDPVAFEKEQLMRSNR